MTWWERCGKRRRDKKLYRINTLKRSRSMKQMFEKTFSKKNINTHSLDQEESLKTMFSDRKAEANNNNPDNSEISQSSEDFHNLIQKWRMQIDSLFYKGAIKTENLCKENIDHIWKLDYYDARTIAISNVPRSPNSSCFIISTFPERDSTKFQRVSPKIYSL